MVGMKLARLNFAAFVIMIAALLLCAPAWTQSSSP